ESESKQKRQRSKYFTFLVHFFDPVMGRDWILINMFLKKYIYDTFTSLLAGASSMGLSGIGLLSSFIGLLSSFISSFNSSFVSSFISFFISSFFSFDSFNSSFISTLSC